MVARCINTLSYMSPSRRDVSTPRPTEEELRWLESHGQVMRRSAGHVFMAEGETTDFVLLIRKGHVKVTAGTPKRIVALRGPDQFVGEMAPLSLKPRSASVEAVDEIEVLRISASMWLEFLDRFPRAAKAQLVALNERLEEATRKISATELVAEQRMAKALVEVVDSGLGAERGEQIVLTLAQQDVAELAGISLESVKKLVRTFREAGVLDTSRRRITIVDRKRLRDIAAGEKTATA
jgi:CRP-like cAMP-binding protein